MRALWIQGLWGGVFTWILGRCGLGAHQGLTSCIWPRKVISFTKSLCLGARPRGPLRAALEPFRPVRGRLPAASVRSFSGARAPTAAKQRRLTMGHFFGSVRYCASVGSTRREVVVCAQLCVLWC